MVARLSAQLEERGRPAHAAIEHGLPGSVGAAKAAHPICGRVAQLCHSAGTTRPSDGAVQELPSIELEGTRCPTPENADEPLLQVVYARVPQINAAQSGDPLTHRI